MAGDLSIPPRACRIVIFAHGSGIARQSPRNRLLARYLYEAGFATLLFDLLTPGEEAHPTAQFRFDVGRLAGRVFAATDWVARQRETAHMTIGYFGTDTGAAAALVAAAHGRGRIDAVVSGGGRPDLAGDALPLVQAPTLLIVGGRDDEAAVRNEDALATMRCPRALRIVPRALREPGALEQVARLAIDWFDERLGYGAAHEARA